MIELEGQRQWLDILLEFAKNIRIASKEETSADDRGVPLKMWGSQKYALQQVCNGMDEGVRNFMVLKSRQLGISTIFLVLDLLWLALHPNLIGALVTDTDTNRAVFRQTLERYVASFPKGFLGKNFEIVKKNKDFLLFSNGSRLDLIVAGKSKATWGEGRGYALCHLTEVANFGNVSGLNSFKETLAEKNPNRLFLYESTAKGFNHWYDMWIEYARDKFTKKGIFIGWWAKDINIIEKSDPRFEFYGAEPPNEEEQELIDEVKEKYGFDVGMEQLAWYRWKASDQSTNEMDLLQNAPWTESQAFVMSGYSFFQNRLLTQNMEAAQQETFFAYGYKFTNSFKDTRMYEITDPSMMDEATLRVWEQPSEDEEAVYAIGCDPAFGRNDWADRHNCSVWRCYADKMVQVAEYADNQVETRQAAWVLAHLAGTYKNCYVNVELTGGPGRAVLTEFEHLRELAQADPKLTEGVHGQPNFEDFLSNAKWYLFKRADSFSAGHMKGWEMTGRSKFELMNQVRDQHSTDTLVIRSVHLLNEMKVVVQDGSEIAAPGRAKDDRVFGMALAVRVWIDSIRSGLIARQETYEIASKREMGNMNQLETFTHKLVQNFFKRAEEMAEAEPEPPKWKKDRGLV